jgi:hypothetical protein
VTKSITVITFCQLWVHSKCHKIKLGILHQLLGFPLVSCCQSKGFGLFGCSLLRGNDVLIRIHENEVFYLAAYYIPHVQRDPFIWYSLHQKKDPSIDFLRNLNLCQKIYWFLITIVIWAIVLLPLNHTYFDALNFSSAYMILFM